MNRLLASLFCTALLLLPSAATAGKTPEPCELVKNVLQKDWIETEVGFVAAVQFEVTKCFSDGDLFASAEGKATFTIECTVTVTEKVHDEGWYVNLLIFWIGSRTVETEVSSHVKCDGSATLTVEHTGGVGPRVATSTVTGVGFGSPAANTQGQTPSLPTSKEGCAYTSPIEDGCSTVHPLGASYGTILQGVIPTSIEACIPFEWTNEMSGLPGLNSYSGDDEECSDPIPIVSLDTARLTRRFGQAI